MYFVFLYPWVALTNAVPNQNPRTKVLEDESVEVEARRKALEEAQDLGRQELEAGREELKLAAEGLEGEKEDMRAARKVLAGVSKAAYCPL